MKNKICILLIIIFNCVAVFGQAPNYLWAKSDNGNSNDDFLSIATDANGNVYTAGSFMSSSLTFGTSTLVNVFSSDILLAKYDPNGNALWAKSAGGDFGENAYGVATDLAGNVIITGQYYSSPLPFGSYTLTTVGGSNDVFIAKYNSLGNLLWVKSEGGSSADFGHAVSTDGNNNIYVVGYYDSQSMSVGSTTFTNAGTGPQHSGTGDVFLIKYDPSGNVVWAKRAGGEWTDQGSAIATDANGNTVITGYFNSSTITFGNITLTNTSSGDADMFVVKYDSFGNVLWAKSSGGTSLDAGNGIAIDTSGNVFVTGFFASSAIAFESTTLINQGGGYPDMFVTKYDASGNVIWAKRAGSYLVDEGSGVATDEMGNVFITGYFRGFSITFGTATLTNTNGSGANGGTADIFMVKYDAGGNVLWAKSTGGSSHDFGNSICIDPGGDLIVTGSFESSSISFGSTTFNKGNNYYSPFLVKLANAVGVEENYTHKNNMSIFPNPCNGALKLQIDKDIKNAEIVLINSIGQAVHNQTVERGLNTINLTGLAKGLYYYVITEDKSQNKNGKIIIE